MSNELKIDGIVIRKKDGLYCLNDVWRSRGAIKAHNVNQWSRNEKTKELIKHQELITRKSVIKQSAGRHGGTYVSKELVYDYAMWISPEFKSHVIDVFNSHVVSGVTNSLGGAINSIKMSMVDINERVNSASIHFDDIKECGRSWGKAGSEIRRAKKEAIEQLELIKNEIQIKLDF